MYVPAPTARPHLAPRRAGKKKALERLGGAMCRKQGQLPATGLTLFEAESSPHPSNALFPPFLQSIVQLNLLQPNAGLRSCLSGPLTAPQSHLWLYVNPFPSPSDSLTAGKQQCAPSTPPASWAGTGGTPGCCCTGGAARIRASRLCPGARLP